tara:strand:- start:1345 stop:1626 length:282 start_codon:yes stop_codon:yes gene_type:complete
MPKKDVCYVATDALEPKYLKGQIIVIKDPGFEWSEVERGKKDPEQSKMRFGVKTLNVTKAKLTPNPDKRLVIIKKNGKDFIDVVPQYHISESD